MIKNKTFSLLSRLSKDEIKQFTEFVSSPFFNKRTDVIKLAEYLESIYPSFTEEYVSEEKIYRVVFGEGSCSTQVVKNLASRLQTLLEKFLMQLGLEKDRFLQANALTYELRRKGSFELSERELDKSMSRINSEEVYSPRYMKLNFDYLETKNDILTATHINYKKKIENLNLRSRFLVDFFLLALLRIANENAAFKYVLPGESPANLFEDFFECFDIERFLELLKIKQPEQYPVIALFYYGLQSKINDPEGVNREKLKKLTFENFGRLRKMDLIECWSMLFAAYVFSDQCPVQNLSEEVHEIDKFFIDREIYFQDDSGFMMENSYHNIAMQAISAGDYSWVENFLKSYKEKLPPGIRENLFNFCMGIYCFNKAEYENSISYLSRVKADDIMSNLHIRNTHIKSYYELGYYDEAESAIFAFQNFISQSKALTRQVKGTLPAFIRYSKMLIKAKSSGKPFPGHIYEKAKKGGGFMSKKWVIEKMEELL
jgi:hypothetical protein